MCCLIAIKRDQVNSRGVCFQKIKYKRIELRKKNLRLKLIEKLIENFITNQITTIKKIISKINKIFIENLYIKFLKNKKSLFKTSELK